MNWWVYINRDAADIDRLGDFINRDAADIDRVGVFINRGFGYQPVGRFYQPVYAIYQPLRSGESRDQTPKKEALHQRRAS